jgi:hypothetical protein
VLGISVGPLETFTDGVKEELDSGRLVGSMDTAMVGEMEGPVLSRSIRPIEAVTDGGVEGRLLGLEVGILDASTEGGMLGREPGSVDGASSGEDVGASLPLVEGLAELTVDCDGGKSLGEKVGAEIGVFVRTSDSAPVGDSELPGLSVGDLLGLEDAVGEKVGDDVGLFVGVSDGVLLG